MGETKNKTSMGLEQNLAGLLCYVGWWITGIVFLVMEKENKFVRFHAVQSIVTFGAVSVFFFIFSFIFGLIPFIGALIDWLLWVAAVILWIVLMLKAYQGQMFKVPIAGDIAERNSKPQAK